MVEIKVFNNVVEQKMPKLLQAVEYKMNIQWYFTIIRFYDYFQEDAV